MGTKPMLLQDQDAFFLIVPWGRISAFFTLLHFRLVDPFAARFTQPA